VKKYNVQQKILLCTFISVLILSFLPGSIQAAATEESGHFFLTTYYWKPTTDGDVTVESQTQAHSVDTRESLETSNFGGMIKGEKFWGRWGLAFDLLLIALEDESRFGGTEIDAILDTSMTEFSFLWRLAERTTGGALMHDQSTTGWVMDLEGGVRHTRVDLELDIDPGADAATSDNWVEPFVGGRVLYRPSRKWILGLSMDAGGFGIGSASDLTWNLTGGADYRLGEEKWVQVGYRMMGIQFEDSSGQAGVNMRVTGPMAAIRLDF
jgi:hypothetical protein